MRLETDRAIGSAFADSNGMRQAMITIAEHVQSRGEQQDWAEHLRFLTPYRRAEMDSPDEEDPSEDGLCGCAEFDDEIFRSRERRLRITTPNDTPGCIHYVAVSYCWTSSARAVYTGEAFTIQDASGEERAPACPSSLLDRVIQFASWKQMSFIWIDQQCINQSDLVDQSVGIQAMDLVYQRAAYSLAVLEVCVEEQRHLDALEQLYENSADLHDQSFARDVVDALRIIMSDQWFERAWCLQESTSGNRNMTLLIRVGEDLDVPTYLASEVDGCFELDLPWLHTMISSLGWPLEEQQDTWPDRLRKDVQDIMDLWYSNMPPDASTEHDPELRTVCNAAQALCHLEKRQNSVVADRLAIMANLCGYEVRLDANALDRLGFDFSICALTLAILNGDFSIQVGYGDYVKTGKGGRKSMLLPSDATLNTTRRPFSWCLPPSASLDQLAYYDHDALALRTTVSTASIEHGLEVKGCLYVADGLINLATLATSFNNGTYTQPPGVIDVDVIGFPSTGYRVETSPSIHKVHFLLQLLCTLHRNGFSGLVELLWNQFRHRGKGWKQQEADTLAKYADASFGEIIDIDTGDIKWPNPIAKFSPSHNHVAERTHPFIELSDNPILEHIMGIVLTSARL